jgi:hypothetical protein
MTYDFGTGFSPIATFNAPLAEAAQDPLEPTCGRGTTSPVPSMNTSARAYHGTSSYSAYSLRVRTLGWSTPFPDQPWSDIASRLHGVLDSSPTYESVLDVVDSVIAYGVEPFLAGLTSTGSVAEGSISPPAVVADE